MSAIPKSEILSGLKSGVLKDVLKFKASYIEQLKGRAQFFIDSGNDDRALMMLDLIEELDAKDNLASLKAIEILLRQGRSDAAEKKIAALLGRAPDNTEAWLAHIQLLLCTGRLIEAVEPLRAIIAADPRAKTQAGRRARAIAAQAFAQFEKGR